MNTKNVNILLIMADQMRADCIEAVNSTIKTPNLQRLVDNGVLIERAYAPTPVCLPCRVSVLTGQYPSTHGCCHNETCLPRDYLPNMAMEFKKAGYYTHFIGKSHINSVHDKMSFEAPPNIHNYDFFKQWKGPWYGFDNADICVGHTTEYIAPSMHYGAWLEEKGVDIQKYFGNTAYTQYGPWDLPEEYHNSKWVAEITKNAIEKSRQGDQPFLIWANFQDPHNPCMVPEPWASMYDPAEIKKHGFKPGEPESFKEKPPFYERILGSSGGYRARDVDPGLPGSGNVSRLPFSDDQVQENAACYYGMVSLMDKYIGEILDKLEEMEMMEDTLIVFTSDHGDFLGDHGLYWKSVVTFDEAMHVPLIISYPRMIPKGRRCKAFHSLIDLPTTFLSFAGLKSPRFMEGEDQKDVWTNPDKCIRDDVIVEERPYNTDFNEKVLINDEFKLTFFAGRDYGELYNIKDDPDQIHNLWDDEKHASIKLEMISRILSYTMNKHANQPNSTTRIAEEMTQEQINFPDYLNE
ncbi:MAG: sulfatase [Candidatus Hodarchaeota archaeon]